ncbi:GNAT family N-acetyltransferase [Paenibacillus paeoniae]|uniref:GNAT family acetyltransferase n=1 Tax=Paenibacillus paeoniae TaxID=2292705 RepID=A0A371P659_9BACL|nr:GNAT family N-acetyltransferase [Paenibacillus paeoniae]REK71431.1 GNAT family acetyltransferase [Paenibacillus paeoniae]
MGEVRLVKPSLEYREAYLEFYEDWLTEGVEAIVPWVAENDPHDFEAYVAFLYAADSEEKLTNDDFVPHSTYWLINEEDEVVGAVNIRHRLNQKLLESGGHIGYGIRPSRRGRGYATAQLAEALKVTKAMGIERVLLVCDQDNEASERTIRRAGGVQDSQRTTDNGEVLKRFWIDL